ncbi:MAG: phage portal protein [Cellulomonas sp.]|uniref:phage portal protein n=1 Tax=Cellulomonas sp. 73-92 TaxID=1895740 RepID=UPI000929417C|nr:phage portal protein [Cellulomonas sp. 73-92]MBN9374895.1 phage portal protein [Cellulomonas sp.]OJV76500.1 MAG: hypothetical protein BGO37_10605 [Cellulomonas sp. 73-92]
MSLLRRDQVAYGTPQEWLARSRASRLGAPVTSTSAMRNSAYWAALRLRSELIGMLPVDTYRRIAGENIDVDVPSPMSMVQPSSYGAGQPMGIGQWISSTQMDLDRFGNCLGLIVARDAFGLPAVVDPVPFEDAAIHTKGSKVVGYRLGRSDYTTIEVWHERAYVPAGSPIGLSPLAAAAWSLQASLSAQAFAIAWFQGSAVPSGELVWNKGELDAVQAETHKRRFMTAVQSGEPFVHGKDWTYNSFGAKASEAAFLDQQKGAASDVCRYIGVPGDMVDVPVDGSSVTYANVTQRNLQLMVINLNAPIVRRETALSQWLPRPRFVKLNSDALLRMDPQQREQILLSRVAGKVLAPSEERALNNLPPFTPEQIDEMKTLQIIGEPAKQQPKTTGGIQ